MSGKPIVMISSTARDLPEYRKQVMDACLRAGMDPRMMEHLPALSMNAIEASLDLLVDRATIYLGIFAHRYGYIPDGHEISITQMEYERAVERGIPRLVFVMHDDAPVAISDIEFENKPKLDKLKERLKKDQVIAFFRNPDDLRAQVIQSLVEVQKHLDAGGTDDAGRPTPAALAKSLHHVSTIPAPPEPYIAHPYTLLQVRRLVGRKEEMELLTDWVTGKRFEDVRIFSVVAIGGMGKSALTWTWFNDVAPQEMAPLAGRLWWSFYESDATYENFVTRALAYVSRRRLDEVKQLGVLEQEDQLLGILDQESFLLALDGLERILTAYARQDAGYLRDHEVGRSAQDRHRLRKTADLRAGRFLRKLAGVRASRILVSTRLFPAELEAPGGEPSPGSQALPLDGLSDHDALALWRAYGAKGSREQMLPVFNSFGKHPLLLQLLAYEVAEFREAPGDFDAWQAANPGFNPFGLEITNVQTHILEHALHGLTPGELRTLHVIAGFRMPASMETLKSLLIRASASDDSTQMPFGTMLDLDRAMTVLEDRGLLGWDRRANRYDLHPIVRGVLWATLRDDTRTDVYNSLRAYFETMPMPTDHLEVETLEDLTPAIELYNTLIGLRLYDEAFAVFRARLSEATLYRLSASRLRITLLEQLFGSGVDSLPSLLDPGSQGFTLNALAQGYQFSGQPGTAIPLFLLGQKVAGLDQRDYNVALCNLSDALYFSGKLRASEASARAAVIHFREQHGWEEAVGLYQLSIVLAARGVVPEAITASLRVLRMFEGEDQPQGEGYVKAGLAQLALWQGETTTANQLADQAWQLGGVRRLRRDLIRAARLQGTAALHKGLLTTANERLHYALPLARAVSLVDAELPTLVALAELHHHQNQESQARAMLDDVWDAAERGPYPLFHADALNVLAQIERDAGNREAAVEAATKAYRLAWCDGPPFAYHWGLEKAKAHLVALGAPEPEMPPFDESKHEPMPEVEINPPDEFGGDDEPAEDEVAE